MPRGFVVIRVKEASGRNKGGNVVWDPNFIEGFMRAEMRSENGTKIVENSTAKRVIDNRMTWDEELRLEVKDGSKELRLMLCKEKRAGTRTGTSCVAACGIFVADILKAVPINKYFELYKPKATEQAEGGFVKVSIDFEDHSIRPRSTAGNKESGQTAPAPRAFATEVSGNLETLGQRGAGKSPSGTENEAPESHAPATIPEQPESQSRGHPVIKAGLFLAAVGAGAAFYLLEVKGKKEGDAKLTRKDFSDRK